MPEARLQKARATLPDGYQFGDGVRVTIGSDFELRFPAPFNIAMRAAQRSQPTIGPAIRVPLSDGCPECERVAHA